MAHVIKEILVEMRIEKNLLSITSDNASINTRLCIKLKQLLPHTTRFEPELYVGCSVHTFNLYVVRILSCFQYDTHEDNKQIINDELHNHHNLSVIRYIRGISLYSIHNP